MQLRKRHPRTLGDQLGCGVSSLHFSSVCQFSCTCIEQVRLNHHSAKRSCCTSRQDFNHDLHQYIVSAPRRQTNDRKNTASLVVSQPSTCVHGISMSSGVRTSRVDAKMSCPNRVEGTCSSCQKKEGNCPPDLQQEPAARKRTQQNI